MNFRGKIIKHFFFIFLVYFFFNSHIAFANTTEEPEKKILILNSYHKDVKWSDDIIAGIKSSLKASDIKFDIHVEYMDTKKFYGENYIKSLYEMYKNKYKNSKFDSIISIDNAAFDFLREYSKELFPNTPMVFCGVNYFKDSMLESNSLFTGVVENIPIKETLDLALNLHKNTKNVIIIVSNSVTGKATKNALNEIIPYYVKAFNINFTITENFNLVNDKEELKQHSKDTIALLLSGYTTDYQDNIMTERDGDIILNDVPIPVYATWDFLLNHGVIGGKILSGKSHGEVVGLLTSRVLMGINPSNIPVVKNSESQYVFDYKQLLKYSIKSAYLPKNSIINNLPIKSYTIPTQLIWFFVILIITLLSFLILNISERRDAKAALIESEERLRTLINTFPALICLKDSKGRWVETNKAAIEFFNLDPVLWKGKTDKELLELNDVYIEGILKYQNFDNLALKKAQVTKHTEVFKKDTEEEKILEIIKMPIIDANNNSNSLVVIGQDITSLVKAQENKRLLNELVAYENLRTEFFANLSHELRTPLNVILSALQYIELIHANYNEHQHNNFESYSKYTSIMKQNCYRLVRIVNNLIDITKIDSGYFELELENYNIVEVIEEISLSVASYAETNGLSLIFDTDVEEKIIACDANMIERIILNLISNAIKFTDSGGQISINVYDLSDTIQISVKDTGIGIAEDKQASIFERFIQVDKSLSRNREGSGIGLSLVKSLVELHGGTIKLISELNKGSSFIISLPVYVIPDKEIKLYSDTVNHLSSEEKINIEFSDIY
ncbi:alkaline phosphatase synthesis sensor protein PhoR [Clostridium homopropionicum DSM 5847]|uniref:histidine kinase n=1 Tax=Clostridium homopropionicum DSM 5847 TaxID=1121318 RepID=A0A0L6Z7N4_9CLOT|nr:ABC transporter substrate binding protein [Clostridium homopropionicum]KOA18981.1 alkaline phosphatase synthesis sensor protein PhoR [Clostridium homopropionicum DSM 5847]SFG42750.1 PAS domain S-box-containing protein [Clostridium homopropionicum]